MPKKPPVLYPDFSFGVIDMSWQELFNQNTIRRGEAFFRAGRVSEPFLINTYTYQLTVADPVPHTVILRCQNDQAEEFFCSCDQFKNGFTCAHLAASLLALEEKHRQDQINLNIELSDQAAIHPFKETPKDASYFRFHEITEGLLILDGIYQEAEKLFQEDQISVSDVHVGYRQNADLISEPIMEAHGEFPDGSQVDFSCERNRLLRLSCSCPECQLKFQTDLGSVQMKRPICLHQTAFLLSIRNLMKDAPIGDRTTKGAKSLIRRALASPRFYSGLSIPSIRLLPRLIIENRTVSLGLRIFPSGENAPSFIVHSLSDLIQAVRSNSLFHPSASAEPINFSRTSLCSDSFPLFELLCEMTDHAPAEVQTSRQTSSFPLSGICLDRFFDLYSGSELECLNRDSTLAPRTISLSEGPLPSLSVSIASILDPAADRVEGVVLSGFLPPFFSGIGHTYVLDQSSLIRLKDSAEKMPLHSVLLLQLLSDAAPDGMLSLTFGYHSLNLFFRYILPFLKSAVSVETENLHCLSLILPPAAHFTLSFDLLDGWPLCRIFVTYGTLRFCLPKDTLEIPDPLRDILLEKRVSQMVLNYLPKISDDTFTCEEESDRIFEFFHHDLAALCEEANSFGHDIFAGPKIEIQSSEAFQRIRILEKLSCRVLLQLQDQKIELTLELPEVCPHEFWHIIDSFRSHQTCARLENGSFLLLGREVLILSELLRIQQITREVFESSCLSGSSGTYCRLQLARGRIFSIDALLKDESVSYQKDSSATQLLSGLLADPAPSAADWLYSRISCGFGAALVYDLCLEIRLPVIRLLERIRKDGLSLSGHEAPSLIICPSSLMLYWKDLIESSSSNLQTAVLQTSEDFTAVLPSLIRSSMVLITSFQSLSENSSLLGDICFDCEIIDGFHVIRNTRTLKAQAADSVHAGTRIVLTDPLTASRPADQWVLFRFLMKDYLSSPSPLPEELTRPFICQKLSKGQPDSPLTINRTIRLIENTTAARRQACQELILSAVRSGHRVLVLSSDRSIYPLLQKDLRKIHINSILPESLPLLDHLPGLIAFSSDKRESSVRSGLDVVLFFDHPDDPEIKLKDLSLDYPQLRIFLTGQN